MFAFECSCSRSPFLIFEREKADTNARYLQKTSMANEKSPAMIGDWCEWGIMQIFPVISFCGRTISDKYVVDFHDALIEKASKNLLISESKRSFSNQDLKKGMLFCTSTAVEKKRMIWTT